MIQTHHLFLCDMQTETMVDARDDSGHTPLHEAIQKDHSRLVELLIGYGADPTIIDEDEVTPLHLVLDNDDMESPSEDSPELNKVGMTTLSLSLSNFPFTVCCLVYIHNVALAHHTEPSRSPHFLDDSKN